MSCSCSIIALTIRNATFSRLRLQVRIVSCLLFFSAYSLYRLIFSIYYRIWSTCMSIVEGEARCESLLTRSARRVGMYMHIRQWRVSASSSTPITHASHGLLESLSKHWLSSSVCFVRTTVVPCTSQWWYSCREMSTCCLCAMTDADMAAENRARTSAIRSEGEDERVQLGLTIHIPFCKHRYMYFTVPLYDDPPIKIPPLWASPWLCS